MANGTIIAIIHLQLTYANAYNKNVLRPHGAKKKNFAFTYGPLINLSLSKITYKYNYVDLYSGVVFIFF